MRPTLRVLLIALLVGSLGLLAARAEPRAAFRLEALVPGSTLAFVSLEDLDRWTERMQGTALGRMMQDPEMRAFLAPLEEAGTGLMEKALAEMPPALKDGLALLGNLRAQVAIALVDLDLDAEKVSAAMSMDFGDATADFTAFLLRLSEEMDPEGRHVRSEIKDGRAWFHADLGPMALHATTHDTTFLASTDEALLQGLLAGASAASLEANVDFQTVRAKCGGDALGMFAFANVAGALERFGGMMGAQERRIANALGLDTIRGAGYGMSFQGDGFRDTLVLHAPGADHGLVTLVEMKPIGTPTTLDLVPSSAFVWGEENLPFADLLARIRALVQAVDPDAVLQMDDGLEQGNGMLGVDLEHEVLAGLAGTYGAWMAMPPAGGLYPELAWVLTLKDGASFEGIFERMATGLAGVVNEEGDVVANPRTMEYHGVRLHLFEIQAAHGRDPVPFTPSWAVLGNRLIVTLVPHTLQEIVLRASGENPTPGLASREDFQALLEGRPRDAGAVGYVDLKSVLTLLYGTVVPMLQTVAKPNVMQEIPLAFDWALLPPLSRVAPYFRSMAGYVTWNRDGVVVAWQGPIPLMPVVLSLAASAAFLGFSRATVAMPPMTMAIEEDDDGTNDLDLEMDLEMAQLQVEILATAVERYRAERSALPSRLEDLVSARLLPAVSTDPWGGVYVLELGGEGFAVVSPGPDRRLGTGDDVRVERN